MSVIVLELLDFTDLFHVLLLDAMRSKPARFVYYCCEKKQMLNVSFNYLFKIFIKYT